jgi:arginyl-tRNA synthetase
MDNVVRLQAGDARIRHAWAMIVDLSRTAYQEIYSRLHIRIEERGESFYQPFMADIVKLLTGEGAFANTQRISHWWAGVIQHDEGRQIVWPPGFSVPLTVVKSDGGYTYDTSDLAALRQRLFDEHADVILYVVDAGQVCAQIYTD